MYMKKHTCRKCNTELTEQNCLLSRIKNSHYICNECEQKRHREYRIKNLELIKKRQREYIRKNHESYIEYQREYRRKNIELCRKRVRESRRKLGVKPMNENRNCSLFLGVHVAERVLSKVFKDVKRMNIHNPGYDFICNKGMKIDVKSSCVGHNKNYSDSFSFHIERNKIADYFLCLAFDSRENLKPIHIWLIPGKNINHLMAASISETTINKWDEYRLPIDKVVKCCEVLKS